MDTAGCLEVANGVLHFLEGAIDPSLHRANGPPFKFCNFWKRLFFVVKEQEGQPLLRGKARYCVPDHLGELVLHDRGYEHVDHVRASWFWNVVDCINHVWSLFLVPVYAGASRDEIHPGRELCLLLETSDVGVGLEKRVLADLLCILVVAIQELAGAPEHRLLPTTLQLIKRVPVSRDGQRRERSIRARLYGDLRCRLCSAKVSCLKGVDTFPTAPLDDPLLAEFSYICNAL